MNKNQQLRVAMKTVSVINELQLGTKHAAYKNWRNASRNQFRTTIKIFRKNTRTFTSNCS